MFPKLWNLIRKITTGVQEGYRKAMSNLNPPKNKIPVLGGLAIYLYDTKGNDVL